MVLVVYVSLLARPIRESDGRAASGKHQIADNDQKNIEHAVKANERQRAIAILACLLNIFPNSRYIWNLLLLLGTHTLSDLWLQSKTNAA